MHRAPSIKVAEAAKVIENTQRDLNIALMNELALIFDRMGIRTQDVLEAAGTKWNFLKFSPGLVGGHCIGVDPYYLTTKAQELGYLPEVILAGRRINNNIGPFIAQKCVKMLTSARRAAAQGEGRHPRPDVQGERARPAQLEDSGHRRTSSRSSASTRWSTIRSATRARRTRSTRSSSRRSRSSPGLDAVILAVAHDGVHRRTSTAIFARVRDGGVVIDVKSAIQAQAAARHPALEPLSDTQPLRRSLRGPGQLAAPLARHRRRRVHRLGAARELLDLGQTVVGVDNFITGHKRNLDDVLSINPDERLQFQFIEGDLRDPEVAKKACKRRRHRPAPGRARLGAALDQGSARRRTSTTSTRSSTCLWAREGSGRQARRLRVELVGVRRSPGPAEARGSDRQAAVAVRGDEARRRDLRAGVPGLLRHADDRAALLQRVRPPPGSERPVRRRDPALDRERCSKASRA